MPCIGQNDCVSSGAAASPGKSSLLCCGSSLDTHIERLNRRSLSSSRPEPPTALPTISRYTTNRDLTQPDLRRAWQPLNGGERLRVASAEKPNVEAPESAARPLSGHSIGASLAPNPATGDTFNACRLGLDQDVCERRLPTRQLQRTESWRGRCGTATSAASRRLMGSPGDGLALQRDVRRPLLLWSPVPKRRAARVHATAWYGPSRVAPTTTPPSLSTRVPTATRQTCRLATTRRSAGRDFSFLTERRSAAAPASPRARRTGMAPR
jgi:hypothetical protein